MIILEQHPKQYERQDPSDYSTKEQQRLIAEFDQKTAYLRTIATELTPYDYFRELFPLGLFEDESAMEQSKPNGMISILRDPEYRGRSYTRILFNDLAWINKAQGKANVIVPLVSFSGRKRTSKNAYLINGIIIDLDYVGIDNIKDLIYEMENQVIPHASYLVNSGTGVHVVYLFDEPLPAFKRLIKPLNQMKKELIDLIWNKYTSTTDKKQYQGIFQGYRIPGSQVKFSNERMVTVFRIGPPVSLKYLNMFVDSKVDFDDISHISLDEAKEIWPDWYQRRVVEKRQIGDYDLDEAQRKRRRAWYDSWYQRIQKGAIDGNRYYCIGILFNYAMKAEISKEEAYDDAMKLLPWLNSLTVKEGNEFTEEDIKAAMRFYDKSYIKLGRNFIKNHTNIELPVTERKGRSQKSHLARARAVQKVEDPEGSWRNKNGRPKGSGTKEDMVRKYIAEHPDANPTSIARELGISRPTVYKYMKDDKSTKKVENKEIKKMTEQERRMRMYAELLKK